MSYICSAYIIYLVSVHLLVFPEDGYETIYQTKYFSFAVSTSIVVIICTLLWIELRLVNLNKVYCGIRKPSPFVLALALYVFFTVISAVMSPYSGVWIGNGRLDGVITIVLYVLLAVVVAKWYRFHWSHILVFSASITVCSIIGVLQLLGSNPFGLYPENYTFFDAGIHYASQFWGTIGNSDYVGALLILSTALFSGVIIRGKQHRSLFCVVPLFVSVFSIWCIRVDAALLTLLIGLIIVFPFIPIDWVSAIRMLLVYGVVIISIGGSIGFQFDRSSTRWNSSLLSITLIGLGVCAFLRGVRLLRKRNVLIFNLSTYRKVVLSVVVFLCAACFLIVFLFDNLPISFFNELHNILYGHIDDTMGSGRIYIWKEVLKCIQARPILGGGPDTLVFRDIPPFERIDTENSRLILGQIDAAHNEYLNIWVNQGLFSLVSYIGILIACIRQWILRFQNEEVLTAGLCILFYAIYANFGISSICVSCYYWVALGIMIKSEREEKSNERMEKNRVSKFGPDITTVGTANLCVSSTFRPSCNWILYSQCKRRKTLR